MSRQYQAALVNCSSTCCCSCVAEIDSTLDVQLCEPGFFRRCNCGRSGRAFAIGIFETVFSALLRSRTTRSVQADSGIRPSPNCLPSTVVPYLMKGRGSSMAKYAPSCTPRYELNHCLNV